MSASGATGDSAGIHRCLGAALARMELVLVFGEWLRAVPAFELEPGFDAHSNSFAAAACQHPIIHEEWSIPSFIGPYTSTQLPRFAREPSWPAQSAARRCVGTTQQESFRATLKVEFYVRLAD